MKSNITGRAQITINAPASKVWEALTTPAIIKQYFFGTDAVSDWKVGSPLIFKGEWQGKQYQDKGTILESVPQKKFKYDYWSSMGKLLDRPENYMMVTFKLNKDDNDHTLLTLLQENIPDEESKNHSIENWQMVLGNLKRILEEKK